MKRRLTNSKGIIIVVLAVIVATLIFSQLREGEEKLEGRFGIYLENDDLVVSDKDILWYNKTSHEIKLTEEGVEKLEWPWSVHGVPFKVKLDGRTIYTGSFWPLSSSISCSGVVITDRQLVENNIIEIELGYPHPDFFQGVDPRNDNQMFDYLQKTGKLI